MSRILVDHAVLVASRRSGKPGYRQARRWMEDLWRERTGVISSSNLLLFALDGSLSASQILHDIDALLAWNPLPLDEGLIRDALSMGAHHRLGFLEALRYVEARRLGADRYLGSGRSQRQGFQELLGLDFRVPPFGRAGTRPVTPWRGAARPEPG